MSDVSELLDRLHYHVGQLCVDQPGASGSMLEAADTIESLQSTVSRLREAMQEFVDRVDRGEVRSTKTYAKFKKLLA